MNEVATEFRNGHERRISLGPTLLRQLDPRQRTPPAARLASGSGQNRSWARVELTVFSPCDNLANPYLFFHRDALAAN
jgi:hypothetical protein